MEFKTKEFVFLLVLGILIASLGLYSFVRGRQAEPVSAGQLTIMVHVAGCVHRPGLYELPAESRVAHAIMAAGGETPEADINRLNLADFLRDGQKVHVPARVEPGEEEGEGLININTADQKTLETLPNIGPARAQKIIEYREKHGFFSSIEEILNVPTIGPKIFEGIKDLITI